MLLHTENSLLSLLEGEPGVIQKHFTFSDTALQVALELRFLDNKQLLFSTINKSVDNGYTYSENRLKGTVKEKLIGWLRFC